MLEIVLQRHRGRDAVALDQRHRLREDAPVQRLEEMGGVQLDRQILDDSIVDQDLAQKRGLGLDIAGQLTVVPGRDRGRKAGDFGPGEASCAELWARATTVSHRSEEHTSEIQLLMRITS